MAETADGTDGLRLVPAQIFRNALVMPLTHAQKMGLEAAILAYLAEEGGRFARTVAAFKEEAQLGIGGGNGDSNLVVSGAVLEKAWAFTQRGLNGAVEKKAFYDAIESGDMAEVQLYVCVGVDVKALRREKTESDRRDDECSSLYIGAVPGGAGG